MVSLTPLQFGVPGGIELVVVLLISLVFWILPIAAVVLLFYYLRRIDRNVQRLVELQER